MVHALDEPFSGLPLMHVLVPQACEVTCMWLPLLCFPPQDGSLPPLAQQEVLQAYEPGSAGAMQPQVSCAMFLTFEN